MNEKLTPKEKEFWLEEAARWAVRQEDYERYAIEARDKRLQALEKLGMIRRIGKAAVESSHD